MVRYRRLALAAAVLGLASAGSASSASAAGARDTWITAAVKIALLVAEDVSARAVHVDSTDGKVTLHGSVASAGERTRAEALAQRVAGVHVVRNLLQVVERPRRDWAAAASEALQAKVEKRLDADPVLRDSEIRVRSVNEGVVLLDGRARTVNAHLRAVQVARAVRGVKRVASQIESPDLQADDRIWHDATGDLQRPAVAGARDAWITTESQVRLIGNSATPSRDIDVDTQGGVVTLFGTVPTEAARRAAEVEIREVDGVNSVENDLQVVPQESAAPVGHRDEGLKRAIEERLEANDELADASIAVEVADGVVRLSGTVLTQSDRWTAFTLARNTEGVRSVVGDLTVEGQPPAVRVGTNAD